MRELSRYAYLMRKEVQLDEKRLVVLLAFAIFSTEFLISAAMKISYLNILSISLLHLLNNLGIFVLIVAPLLILMPELTESKKRLRRINGLLKAIREINQSISREPDKNKMLTMAYNKLKGVNGYHHVAILRYNEEINRLAGDEMSVENSIQSLKTIEQAIKSKEPEIFTTDRGYFNKGNAAVLPYKTTKETVLLALSSSSTFDSEELNLLEGVTKDIAYAMERCEYENNKMKAIEQLASNLTKFEKSADKLRNPLAVVKSSLELKHELGENNVLKLIEEQVNRMEKELDELREEETETYELIKDLNPPLT